MAIHYYCRHCGTAVGTISTMSVDSEQLGIHKLTDEERTDMVQYQNNGDIHIRTICEDCQESLQRNPDYHQLDHIIH
ncbi:anti-sigma-F factor Fin family protein [Rossellomorea aquimaris]|uniref:anti-sigma-F factor Fin family protein n=1 Tax=Rossellomorea aquimaris TaxID=189382 RepID=UPI001CD68D28|nr:anti-sigma-F factor Fin family protein [Rossellomorea aquimaris]MCA1057263.1 anti-sigma-F factor Fin family protein [Rossellomorea aquimaris]